MSGMCTARFGGAVVVLDIKVARLGLSRSKKGTLLGSGGMARAGESVREVLKCRSSGFRVVTSFCLAHGQQTS